MPRIKEYTSQVSAQGAVNTGTPSAAAFGAPAAKGLEVLGAGLQDATDFLYKHEAQKEVSKLSATMAQSLADTTNDLQERLRTSDPNDSNFSENFLKDYDERMDAIAEGISTGPAREYFIKARMDQRSHMERAAFAGQAELAGIARAQNWEVTKNSLTNTARLNPFDFDHYRAQAALGLEEQVKLGMDRKQAIVLQTRVNQELAVASVRGFIDNDPAKGKAILDSGQFNSYFDEQTRDVLYGEVQQKVNALEAEAERKRKREKELLEQQQQGTQNQFLEKLVSNDLTDEDILKSNLDPFGSGSKEQFIQLIRAKNSGAGMKTDPATFRELFSRASLPDSDPNKLWDDKELYPYIGANKLSFEDMTKLSGFIQGRKTADGKAESSLVDNLMKVAKSKLTESNEMTGALDTDGDERFAAYWSWFMQEYQVQRRSGKSPYELLTPGSKSYLGTVIEGMTPTMEETIEIFARRLSRQERSQLPPDVTSPEAAKATTGAVNLEQRRLPGETAAQYLERRKKAK